MSETAASIYNAYANRIKL